jgi:predicted O-linked N-acetylglucosamine transferase (SPINDLY family)
MRLMEHLSSSVLWLAEGTRESRANLGREAELRGINAKRLIFAPRIAMPDHLARHACADLFLDTPYYSANVTACNALRAGLPMLACYGRTMASRMGASVVEAAGIPEMVACTLADYEERARHLATHPAELASIREKLIDGRAEAPLFQTERRVRHIERAFEQMWARHAAGLPPESFEVMA